MKKLEHYWSSNKDWWYWDENGNKILKPDAPSDAQESYKKYLKQLEGNFT